jgi:hypothetical protein
VFAKMLSDFPEYDAEFVATMEEVLDLYQYPYDSSLAGSQHGQEAPPTDQGNVHTTAGKPKHYNYDYEHKRGGTAAWLVWPAGLSLSRARSMAQCQ